MANLLTGWMALAAFVCVQKVAGSEPGNLDFTELLGTSVVVDFTAELFWCPNSVVIVWRAMTDEDIRRLKVGQSLTGSPDRIRQGKRKRAPFQPFSRSVAGGKRFIVVGEIKALNQLPGHRQSTRPQG